MTKQFENIDVDITDEQKFLLIEKFIEEKLDPASYSMFLDELKQGTYIEYAATTAIVNEMILQALKDHIDRHKVVRTEPVKTTTEVYCTIQFEATHNWTNCNIDEVLYLKYPHRHIFWIKAFKNVDHADRDVEFIVMKRQIQQYLQERYPSHNFGSMSCEMIAQELLEHFQLSRCEVSEDNENGAIVTIKGVN